MLHSIDTVLIDHEDLDDFMEFYEKPLSKVKLLTEDEHTRGKTKYNLIQGDEDDYGIATQLNNPIDRGEEYVDLRRRY